MSEISINIPERRSPTLDSLDAYKFIFQYKVERHKEAINLYTKYNTYADIVSIFTGVCMASILPSIEYNVSCNTISITIAIISLFIGLSGVFSKRFNYKHHIEQHKKAVISYKFLISKIQRSTTHNSYNVIDECLTVIYPLYEFICLTEPFIETVC